MALASSSDYQRSDEEAESDGIVDMTAEPDPRSISPTVGLGNHVGQRRRSLNGRLDAS